MKLLDLLNNSTGQRIRQRKKTAINFAVIGDHSSKSSSFVLIWNKYIKVLDFLVPPSLLSVKIMSIKDTEPNFACQFGYASMNMLQK